MEASIRYAPIRRSAARPAAAVLVALALASGGVPAASAQDVAARDTAEARTAEARSLFGEGVELVGQERWRDAIDRFRRARALHDAPAIRYNLASSLYEVQEYAEAEALVRGVLRDPESSAEIRTHAEELGEQIRTHAGRVEVTLDGDAEGVEVRVGEVEVDADAPTASVLVAPGTHPVTATRGGAEVARESVTVDAGGTEAVRLDVGSAASDEAPAPGAGDPPLVEDWRLWVGVAGAVLVIGAIIVIAAAAGGGVEAPIEGNYDPPVLRF